MPRADGLDCFGIAIIYNQQRFTIHLGRILPARVCVTVINIETMRFAVGRQRNECEFFRFARIGDVVERNPGLRFLTWRRFDGTDTGIVVVAEDENFLFAIHAQIVAASPRIAGNEAERLHVLRIVYIRDQNPKQRRRAVISGEISDAVIYAHRIEA